MTYLPTRRLSARRSYARQSGSVPAGVLVCFSVLLLLNLALLSALAQDAAVHPALVGALLLPMLLTGPAIGYMSMRLRRMAKRNRELEHTATHDGMTSLLNRTAFTAQVSEKLREIAGKPGGRGAFLLVDADHFKLINDRHGHATGDAALRLIAAQLRAVSRSSDMVGRLGGEEFGLFLPDAGLTAAMATADRLRASIAALVLTGPKGEPVALSVSIGASLFREPIGFDDMFQHADRKLYEAKASGRNRVALEEYDVWPALAPAA